MCFTLVAYRDPHAEKAVLASSAFFYSCVLIIRTTRVSKQAICQTIGRSARFFITFTDAYVISHFRCRMYPTTTAYSYKGVEFVGILHEVLLIPLKKKWNNYNNY